LQRFELRLQLLQLKVPLQHGICMLRCQLTLLLCICLGG
jgi:hypothetical protein